MSRGKKRVLILLVLFLTAFILMTIQHSSQRSGKIFILLRSLSYPYDMINSLTSSAKNTLKEFWSAFDENKRLKKDLRDALFERQRYSEVIHENKRLNEMLNMKEHLPNYVTTAKVIARGYDKLLNIVIMDKGKNNGVKKDMAVMSPAGLVGKVYSVKDDFSEVLLLKDPNFSVAVRLQNSRREGIISGTGHNYCLLKYVPPEESVVKGELVITSGLDGVFPQGLPVGVISLVKKEGIEFFQYIQVLPLQSDAKIEEVAVVSK
ncbi:MAG: rod shape-determining protein MreC [Thermodesulfovibrionales bacterium]|nr:rod shape-determining protein MreC [Thermodesulfovibrionales bacterium]